MGWEDTEGLQDGKTESQRAKRNHVVWHQAVSHTVKVFHYSQLVWCFYSCLLSTSQKTGIQKLIAVFRADGWQRVSQHSIMGISTPVFQCLFPLNSKPTCQLLKPSTMPQVTQNKQALRHPIICNRSPHAVYFLQFGESYHYLPNNKKYEPQVDSMPLHFSAVFSECQIV